MTIDNLRVESSGFGCMHDEYVAGVTNLVMAQDRLQYSVADLQAMSAYVQAVVDGSGSTPPPLPPTLALAPGGPKCDLHLAFTNVGATPLQLARVGLRLTRDEQPNAYVYRMINACSLLPQTAEGCPFPYGHAGGECMAYSLTLSLTATTRQGEAADGVPDGGLDNNGQPCPVPVVQPAGVLDLYVTVSAAAAAVLTVTPFLVVTDGGGTRQLTLSALSGSVVIAQEPQMRCYSADGTTFVSQEFVPYMPGSGTWCM